MSSEPGSVTCTFCGRPLAQYERYCAACGRPRPEAPTMDETRETPGSPRYAGPPGAGSPPSGPTQPPEGGEPSQSPGDQPLYQPQSPRYEPYQAPLPPGGYTQPPNQPYGYPPAYAAPEPRGGAFAIASLILGILSLLAWLLPIAGLPVAIAGLILGIVGRGSRSRGLAMGGIVTSSIGLGLSLINAILGAILAIRG